MKAALVVYKGYAAPVLGFDISSSFPVFHSGFRFHSLSLLRTYYILSFLENRFGRSLYTFTYVKLIATS